MVDVVNLVSTGRLIKEADYDPVVNSIRTALAEDINFHGISNSMRQIEPALDSFVVAIDSLLGQLTVGETNRLDGRGAEIDQQIAWYKQEKMVADNLDSKAFVDTSFLK